MITLRSRPMLSILVLMLLSLLSLPAAAQESFAPVVVLDVEGNASDDVKKKLVESVSAAIRKAVLTVYSEEIYGTGQGFKPRAHKSGPMGIAGRVFRGVDRQLEKLVNTELKVLLSQIPADDSVNYSVEILWSKKPHVFAQENAPPVPGGQMFGLLWGMVRRAIGDSENADTLTLIADVVDMPVIQASDIPGGKQTLYNQGRAAYEWMREGQNARFLPLYLGMFLSANDTIVKLDVTTLVKPAELSITLDPPEPKDYVQSETLELRPAFYTQNLPLARFIFERLYRTNGAGQRPTAKVSFGHMSGNDVRSLVMCRQRCDQIGRAGPEHLYRYAPTVRSKLRVPTTFGLNLSGASHRVFSAGVAKVNEYLDLYVMLNEITFDLSGDSIRIIPEKSHLPLIVRLTGPLNGRSYFDVTQGAYGFDFMERLVASEAAREITLTIASTLREGDAVINQQFAGIVGRLNSLIE